MSVPFIDLRAQHDALRDELSSAINEVIAESAFVGTQANRFVNRFEAQFAEFTGRRNCIACANGTDSLEILLRAGGIGPGDEVLVPAVSWIATSEAVSSCGATAVFVDIRRDDYTMDPLDAAAKVTERTAAIIPVHLYGTPARMPELMALAKKHGLFVLEDCAQAHGATLNGVQVGGFGHAASYSFFPSKNLGAMGDAGAMTTDDPDLARLARMIAQHGQGPKKHEHILEGRNSRMDGIQAAVLSVKISRLKQWNSARQHLASRYRAAISDAVEGLQDVPAGATSVYHLFVMQAGDRDRVAHQLANSGITTAVQYPTALPLLDAYRSRGFSAEDFPNAVALTSRVLSLPLFPEMTEQQQDRVIFSLRTVMA